MIKNTPAQNKAIRAMKATRKRQLANLSDPLLKFPSAAMVAKAGSMMTTRIYIDRFRRMNELRTGSHKQCHVPNFLPHSFVNLNGDPL